MTSTDANVFKNCIIYCLPNGIGKKRLSLFENQVKSNGGTYCDTFTSEVTHIVVEDSIAADVSKCCDIFKTLNIQPKRNAVVVNTKWLSECLKLKLCLDTDSYGFIVGQVMETTKETNVSEGESPTKKQKTYDIQKYVCSQASSKSNEATEFNFHITSELQKLADAFRSRGDQWRAHGYDKAISAIKSYGKEITSFEEARAIPSIGEKMAKKVLEILESGQLRKVKEICDDEKTKVLELFTKVWGAGPAIADSWYRQGFRTLEDLKTKANLTKQQKIGLKYFDDIEARIPREEVKEIILQVKTCALSIDPSLKIEPVGSYRRGKLDSGDVDVLIFRKESSTCDILVQIISRLKESNFITDDLTSIEHSDGHRKYLGLCRLPGEHHRHRRLDIFVAPDSEYATALMHYTGSALFNRSIRQLAISKGMKLSEHKLVRTTGQNVPGAEYILHTPSEESIFEHLGIPYRPPEERDH